MARAARAAAPKGTAAAAPPTWGGLVGLVLGPVGTAPVPVGLTGTLVAGTPGVTV